MRESATLAAHPAAHPAHPAAPARALLCGALELWRRQWRRNGGKRVFGFGGAEDAGGATRDSRHPSSIRRRRSLALQLPPVGKTNLYYSLYLVHYVVSHIRNYSNF